MKRLCANIIQNTQKYVTVKSNRPARRRINNEKTFVLIHYYDK